MKIEKITVNVTDVNDANKENDLQRFSQLFKLFEDVLNNGGIVEIEQQYTNAPPDPIYKISSTVELIKWKKKLESIRKIM